LTVPFSVAVELRSPEAEPVTTAGTRTALVAKLASAPSLVPDAFEAASRK
jgi:hypothetical protein